LFNSTRPLKKDTIAISTTPQNKRGRNTFKLIKRAIITPIPEPDNDATTTKRKL
jgi:hypothetical protein